MIYRDLLSVKGGMLMVLFLIQFRFGANAQLPDCGTTDCFIYKWHGQNIYNYDPSQPLAPYVNPVLNFLPPIPYLGVGLAVAKNLNSPAPSPTFYTTVDDGTGLGIRTYWYFNGTAWANTTHKSSYGYIAGGKDYIFGTNFPLSGFSSISRYDGTGDDIIIATVPAPDGGILVDDSDNFYIINQDPSILPTGFLKYNSNGAFVKSWVITGLPYGPFTTAGSLAALGSKIYLDNGGTYIYQGTIVGDTLHFVQFSPGFLTVLLETGFLASCSFPFSALTGEGKSDTVFHCKGGPPVPLISSNDPPITWSVLSGPATINGSGSAVTVTTDSTAVIIAAHGIRCDTATLKDTFRIIVPQAVVSIAGPDTIPGCGVFVDSLQADIWDTTAGLLYQYSWSPSSAIASGGATDHPIITPQVNTSYILTVSTALDQGGCSWNDTMMIAVQDLSSQPDFSYNIHYGCKKDTVLFTNLSANADYYHWNFGDNTGDTATNPVHLYATQSVYNVKLESVNQLCQDTVVKSIDTQHPLLASFAVNDDSVCQGDKIDFTNTSIYTEISGPVRFLWSYGDDNVDTVSNPTHIFGNAGVYDVVLTVTDFVPCTDTAHRLIVIDSLPVVDYQVSDSVVCDGERIVFTASYTHDGIRYFMWDFGSGDVIIDQNPVAHAYDTSGIFTIKATGHYRSCPDTGFSKNIEVIPFPVVDLGPDTFMCPNGQAIMIGDYRNMNNLSASWSWNTGDTTAVIAARHPGIYSARVLIDGCATNDSIEVFKDCYLDIPNAFTPDGDGVNDYFLPRQLLSMSLTGYHMQIFNRWGQLIFETDKTNGRGWDGKFNGVPQPQGVFVYLIEAEFKNGAFEKYQGNVTLVR